MHKIITLVIMSAACFCLIAKNHHYAHTPECSYPELVAYEPTAHIKHVLDDIFSSSVVKKFDAILTKNRDSSNEHLIQLLKTENFKILQIDPNEKSVIVLEHVFIPGYVIKFLRTQGPVVTKSKTKGT